MVTYGHSIMRTSRADIIARIAEKLTSGKYIPGRTAAELAEATGYSCADVASCVAIARRTLQEPMTPEERRLELTSALRAVAIEARAAGDYGAAIRGLAEEAKLHGLLITRVALGPDAPRTLEEDRLDVIRIRGLLTELEAAHGVVPALTCGAGSGGMSDTALRSEVGSGTPRPALPAHDESIPHQHTVDRLGAEYTEHADHQASLAAEGACTDE